MSTTDTRASLLGAEGAGPLPDRLDPSAPVLVDLCSLEQNQARAFLAEVVGLPEAAITDAFAVRHPPKFESFDGGCYLLLLRGFYAEDSGTMAPAAYQFSVIGAPGLLAFYAARPDAEVAGRIHELIAGTTPAAPDALLHTIMRTHADRGLQYLRGVEAWLDDLEAELHGSAGDEVLLQLVEGGRVLHELRRRLEYQAHAVDDWRDHVSGEQHSALLHDLVEQYDRHASLAQLYLQMVHDLRDGYIALASHRLNRVMRVLTVVTVIFLPLTLIAGVYGMNFELMPELGWRYGYAMALGLMVLVASALVLAFRARRWL